MKTPTIAFRSVHDWPDAKWQVIFQTHSGLDYCREPRPADWAKEKVQAWAEAQCRQHDLGGAFIERW